MLLAISTHAQKEKKILLESKEEIVEKAMETLDKGMNPPEGLIYVFKMENDIKGEYVFDITIHEKGKVATVFCDSRDGGDIKSQNKLKDFIKDYSFNFKMPKGKKYKFRYKFNLK